MTHIFPVLGGDDKKIAPPGDVFGQPAYERSLIRSKLADRVEDNVVLSFGGTVLVTSPGTESSNPSTPSLSSNDYLD